MCAGRAQQEIHVSGALLVQGALPLDLYLCA